MSVKGMRWGGPSIVTRKMPVTIEAISKENSQINPISIIENDPNVYEDETSPNIFVSDDNIYTGIISIDNEGNIANSEDIESGGNLSEMFYLESVPIIGVDLDDPNDIEYLRINTGDPTDTFVNADLLSQDDITEQALIVPNEDIFVIKENDNIITYGLKIYDGSIRVVNYQNIDGGNFFKNIGNKIANTGKEVGKKALNVGKKVGKAAFNVGKHVFVDTGKEMLDSLIEDDEPILYASGFNGGNVFKKIGNFGKKVVNSVVDIGKDIIVDTGVDFLKSLRGGNKPGLTLPLPNNLADQQARIVNIHQPPTVNLFNQPQTQNNNSSTQLQPQVQTDNNSSVQPQNNNSFSSFWNKTKKFIAPAAALALSSMGTAYGVSQYNKPDVFDTSNFTQPESMQYNYTTKFNNEKARDVYKKYRNIEKAYNPNYLKRGYDYSKDSTYNPSSSSNYIYNKEFTYFGPEVKPYLNDAYQHFSPSVQKFIPSKYIKDDIIRNSKYLTNDSIEDKLYEAADKYYSSLSSEKRRNISKPIIPNGYKQRSKQKKRTKQKLPSPPLKQLTHDKPKPKPKPNPISEPKPEVIIDQQPVKSISFLEHPFEYTIDWYKRNKRSI